MVPNRLRTAPLVKALLRARIITSVPAERYCLELRYRGLGGLD